MGLSVALEDENGVKEEVVEDPRNLLRRLLPSSGNVKFEWASTIDWYGHTTFNQLQCVRLRDEWQPLIGMAGDSDTKDLLLRIDRLLQRCVDGVHTYVKFYGD